MKFILTQEELNDLVARKLLTEAFANLKAAEQTINELHKQLLELKQECIELKKRQVIP